MNDDNLFDVGYNIDYLVFYLVFLCINYLDVDRFVLYFVKLNFLLEDYDGFEFIDIVCWDDG